MCCFVENPLFKSNQIKSHLFQPFSQYVLISKEYPAINVFVFKKKKKRKRREVRYEVQL